MNDPAHQQFLRFLAVGALNTAFGYGVFALLLFVGLHYSVAAFVSVALGALFNFQTTGRLVFGNRDWRLLVKFCAVYLIIYLLKVGGLFWLERVGVNNYVGGAILILPLAVVSFVLNKFWVFRCKLV